MSRRSLGPSDLMRSMASNGTRPHWPAMIASSAGPKRASESAIQSKAVPSISPGVSGAASKAASRMASASSQRDDALW